jgi:hypothetical protein
MPGTPKKDTMKKTTNHTIKIDKILALDFEKEYIIAGQTKREAQEEAMRDYIAKKKAERKK